MAASVPFTRGTGATLRLYQDGKPVYCAIKNWTVDENATEIQDDVNGEDRSRLDKVTNFFTIDFDVYMESAAFLRSYMLAQDADDANSLPLTQGAAIMFKHRGGTRSAFALQEAKLGPIKVSANSRPDAVMYSCKLRCRYMKPVSAI